MPKYPETTLNTIKYDSPSGEININKWIPPFQEIENGFGFVGVLAEDTASGKLQCHICGKWYDLLTTHVFAKHKITSSEYCEKFGLSRGTALKCMRIRNRQSEVMLGMRKKHAKHRMKFKKGNTQSGNRLGKPKSIETQNRHGVCDLQILDKMTSLKNKLGRTPALTEVIEEYGQAMASMMHLRYNGYLSFLRDNGWTPVVSSHNPKYSKEYFLNIGLKALKSGKPLVGRKLLDENELRNIYNYYSSTKIWKAAVMRKSKKLG